MATPKEINLPPAAKEKYAKGDEIARGKFGIVYHCKSLTSHEPLAVKIMLKRGNKKDDVQREVSILKKLNHPGILQMTDFMDCEDVFVLVTELLSGPELFDYLSEKDFLEEKEARFYMKQLLEATAYMHRNNIIHLDLKPENIVMKDQGGGQLKIIDFGAARDLCKVPNPKVLVGTPEFVAPEVLNFDPASTAADIWAIGVIAYVLLTGMSPFLGDSDGETMMNISSGEFEYPDPEEGYEDISQLAKCFINTMLKLNPKERADAQTCLTHIWLETSESKRLATIRLKSFKARRRWLAVTKLARLTVSFGRLSLKRNGSTCNTAPDTCSVSPGQDDAI